MGQGKPEAGSWTVCHWQATRQLGNSYRNGVSQRCNATGGVTQWGCEEERLVIKKLTYDPSNWSRFQFGLTSAISVSVALTDTSERRPDP